MTVTSLQLHCCPLLLNLNGFDLALQNVLVCFSLPGQRGRTFVRCRACRIHKQLHGKKGSQTEDGGSGGGSSAARQRVEAAEAEARKQAQVVVEAKAKAAARQQALMKATTAAPRQRAEAMEAAEAGARQQAQVVAEAKAKAAALQQAWMEAVTAEARH